MDNRQKRYLYVILAVTISSEIYFYPFSNNFRFAVGVVVLNFFMLMADDLSEIKIASLSGISVFIFRNLMSVFLHGDKINEAVMLNYPSFIYYLCFGILAYAAKVVRGRDDFLYTVIMLTIIDSSSNIIESVLRNNTNSNVVKIIILIGFARSFISYCIFWFSKKQELYIQTKEHQKRYIQLNRIISDIQAETFYLKKSMKDIESVMSKSHSLYNAYKKNEELREQTLTISRDVHEIKKDYYRVLKGFENLLKQFEEDDQMKVSDMFTIIKDNTQRYLSSNNKKVDLSVKINDDFYLKSYYALFSAINNLIINSIQACEDYGVIKIEQTSDLGYLYFKIEDNGEGIDEDILPYVMNAGFTTKFDDKTGKPSTGLGLAHVKNIIEELNGQIDIVSVKEKTSIVLKIPQINIIGDKNE